jgi:sec-independent protein translocase protein TatA
MLDTLVPLFGGLPGGPELIVILLIIVLLFGAQKLPKLARSSGEAMGEFQKGREEVEQELQEMRENKGEGGVDETAREPETVADTEATETTTEVADAESDE